MKNILVELDNLCSEDIRVELGGSYSTDIRVGLGNALTEVTAFLEEFTITEPINISNQLVLKSQAYLFNMAKYISRIMATTVLSSHAEVSVSSDYVIDKIIGSLVLDFDLDTSVEKYVSRLLGMMLSTTDLDVRQVLYTGVEAMAALASEITPIGTSLRVSTSVGNVLRLYSTIDNDGVLSRVSTSIRNVLRLLINDIAAVLEKSITPAKLASTTMVLKINDIDTSPVEPLKLGCIDPWALGDLDQYTLDFLYTMDCTEPQKTNCIYIAGLIALSGPRRVSYSLYRKHDIMHDMSVTDAFQDTEILSIVQTAYDNGELSGDLISVVPNDYTYTQKVSALKEVGILETACEGITGVSEKVENYWVTSYELTPGPNAADGIYMLELRCDGYLDYIWDNLLIHSVDKPMAYYASHYPIVMVPGDVNHDGLTNEYDLSVFNHIYNSGQYSEMADFNGDGVVDNADKALFTDTVAAPTTMAASRYRGRAATHNSNAVFGGGAVIGNTLTAVVDAFTISLVGRQIAPMSKARANYAATTIGDYLLFGGGYALSTVEPQADMDSYSMVFAKGTPTPLSTARNGVSATAVGNYALFGGGTDTSYLSSKVVDTYTTALAKGTTTALTNARSFAAAATIGGYALFAGGGATGVMSNYIDTYTATLAKGTTTALSVARSSIAVATVGDYVLFAGGSISAGSVSIVDIYNSTLVKTTWTSNLTIERHNIAAATLGDSAFFAGGVSGTTRHSNVDVYGPSGTKTYSFSLVNARSEMSATAVGEAVLFSGGYLPLSSGGTNELNAYDINGKVITEVPYVPLKEAYYTCYRDNYTSQYGVELTDYE